MPLEGEVHYQTMISCILHPETSSLLQLVFMELTDNDLQA